MREQLPAILIAVSLLGACTPRASLYVDNQAAESHDVQVIAGDRIVIDGQQVILANAETPRPAVQAACRAEAIAALRAADAVRSTLASARHVEVHPTDQGGDLRLVNVDGLDLGQELIAEGLAVSRQAVAMDWCYRTQPVGEQVARNAADGEQRP